MDPARPPTSSPPATDGNDPPSRNEGRLPETDENRQPEPPSPNSGPGLVDVEQAARSSGDTPGPEPDPYAPAGPGEDVAALARASKWKDPQTRERAHAQRLRKMQIAYDLYTESNLKMTIIGERLGVPASRVSVWVREIERRIVSEMRDRIYNLKARQTAHLEALYRETYAQYLRSRDRRRRKVKTERGIKPEGRVDVRIIEHEDAIGDVKYLAEMRAILADIRRVWGLDAPVKVAATTPEGEAISLAQQSLNDKLSTLADMLKGRAAPPTDDPMLTAGDPPRVN